MTAADRTGETRAVHLLVSGRVQGVGFRYFVLQAARRHGVNGWVRNRLEGDVEIRAEGRRAAVDDLIEEIRRGPRYGRVDHVEQAEIEATDEFRGFDVVM